LKEIIDTYLNNKDHRKLRKKLTKLHREHQESINIIMSSSKILNFLVNDILDFSQLRNGIFRKDSFNFNIKDSLEEIVQI
jgi:signal transduction histidine kinase